MNRRATLRALLTIGVAAAAPLRVFAQQQPKVWRIGSISLSLGPNERSDAFVQRLRDLGYVESKNIVIEWRWAAGDVARLPQIASDLVRLKVDLIVVHTNYIAEVTRRATRTIPIVCPVAADPIGSGLAESLAHPGGNVTGLSTMANELAGKKLELLREILPYVRRVAVLALAHATGPGFATGARLLLDQLRQPAKQLGIEIFPHAAGVAADIPKAFGAARRQNAQALIVQANALTFDYRKLIAELESQQRLPTVYDSRAYAEAGGLISYGPNFNEMYRRGAEIVDKILKGANPADIPFEQPDKYEMVINLKTARTLGLTIPRSLLSVADEVLQ